MAGAIIGCPSVDITRGRGLGGHQAPGFWSLDSTHRPRRDDENYHLWSNWESASSHAGIESVPPYGSEPGLDSMEGSSIRRPSGKSNPLGGALRSEFTRLNIAEALDLERDSYCN